VSIDAPPKTLYTARDEAVSALNEVLAELRRKVTWEPDGTTALAKTAESLASTMVLLNQI
jgi:hypothetical protein